MTEIEFDIKKHILVPEHTKITEEEKIELLKKLGAKNKQMPKILLTDPAIKDIDAKIGDIIKIKRKSPTAKESIYYRLVING
jgi:DNA-directed RNA polymerase subunit H